MRILMVMSDLLAGGAEVTALELVRSLRGSGHGFVIASIKKATVLEPAFRRAGAEVHKRIARFRGDPGGLVRMARLIRRERIQMIVSVGVPRDGMFYGLLGSLLSRRRVPRFVWCKSAPGGQSGWFTRPLRRYHRMGLVDAIICTSRRQREALAAEGLPRRRCVIIHNGVDLASARSTRPARLDFSPETKVVVQTANLMPDKDFGTLLRAAALLKARRDDVRIVLAGRGTDSARFGKRIAEAGADGIAVPLGHRDDVPGLLAAADAFTLSTHSEVFSVATLEAMAAGLPVVVSDIPAFDEMFTAGDEGLKVPPGDADALAGAIEAVVDDDALASRLASAAARRSRRFSREKMAERFLRLISRFGRRR